MAQDLGKIKSLCVTVESFLACDFDFIIVGGGTAGLVVAARLVETGSFSVGVLEAGFPASKGEEEIEVPAFYGRSLGGKHDWQFSTTPQPGLGGRSLAWPRGKILGGTSALNYMTWNRASREDYDAWERLGNPGWGWDSLLPFFKKAESFHPPCDKLKAEHDVSHDPTTLGTSGPMQISYSNEYSPSHKLWHRTLNNLGIPTNPSHVAGSNVGVWTNLNAVDAKTCTRSYSVDYLSRLQGRAPLSILCGATVENVLLRQEGQNCVATGVKFKVGGRTYKVPVRKEVILSGGSVASPQILERSGIGNPEILEAAGIKPLVESPNVGENLQDHTMLATIFEVDASLASPDDLVQNEHYAQSAREQYRKDRSGPLTILPCSLCYVPFKHFILESRLSDLQLVARSTQTMDEHRRSLMQARLNGSTCLGQIEYIFDLGNWSPSFQGEKGKKYGTLLQILQYPFSVGSIHINAATTTASADFGKAQIDPAYYCGSHGNLDLELMKDCLSFGQRIAETQPLSSIIRHRVWPTSSDLQSPTLMQEWIVNNTITDWHPVGTCAMGGAGGIQHGVVDARLRVYGVQRLRVMDASVMPLQISAHPQATVYAIAEKGASMLLEDYAGLC